MKKGTSTLRLTPDFWKRLVLVLTGIFILALVFIFQRASFPGLSGNVHPNVIFIINRTLRLILNDLACFLIILALFKERKFLKITFLVFLMEVLVLLPLYFLIKLSMEGDAEISSPLLSQIHRLIVNPTLMILLMMGFFYQRSIGK